MNEVAGERGNEMSVIRLVRGERRVTESRWGIWLMEGVMQGIREFHYVFSLLREGNQKQGLWFVSVLSIPNTSISPLG